MQDFEIQKPGFYHYDKPWSKGAEYRYITKKSSDGSNWDGWSLRAPIVSEFSHYTRRSCRLEWSLMGGVEVE